MNQMMFNEPKWVDIECVGESTGMKYFGRFYLKPYLTIGEKAQALRLAETYCRGISRDEYYVKFFTTLAYLQFYIVEAEAEWWSKKKDEFDDPGFQPLDDEPIWAITDQLTKIRAKPTGDITDDPGGSKSTKGKAKK